MRLKTVRIENYKSVEDSTEFSISSVTCLVGKNEAGKSTILESLYKLNPVYEEQAEFDEVQEYPRRTLSDYQEAVESGTQKPANVLTTTWELSDQECASIKKAFGQNSLKSSIITIKKGYDNKRRWMIDLDEGKVIAHFLNTSGLATDEKGQLKDAVTITKLIEKLQKIEAPSGEQAAFIQRLLKTFPAQNLVSGAAHILYETLPKFVLFTDYYRMSGQVAIDQLQQKKASNELTQSDRVFLALLDMVGTSPEEIQNTSRFEPLIAKLESVSSRVSREIFKYWSQNKHLKVEFRFDSARPADPAPFNSGYIFRTCIENRRHEVTVSFEDRSTGFVWFFSFLVWFSQVQKTYAENLIILLDEPGLSLHAKAQQDLLRYINEKLQPKYQVIYTTHSPFMVDADNILGVRTVEDVAKDDEILGTKVGDQVLSTDKDTLFPLQAALGYDITQTLFIGKHTLLVEGPSDLLYISWFRNELRAHKRETLDPRWTIAPSGGIDKIASFITLFRGNDLHVAVITDYQDGQKRKIRELKESDILRAGHVFSADTYSGQPEADVEDILGRSFYIALVSACYSLSNAQSLPEVKPINAPNRVVLEVEEHFRMLPADVPEFSHYAPSAFLIENAASLRSNIPDLDQALDRFEKLFKDLNALL